MNLRIYTTTWQQDGKRLGALRREVFIVEQQVPEELEWDEHDSSAVHFACEEISLVAVVGTARLVLDIQNGKATMGRLCVAKPFRHQKIATHLMHKILVYCTEQKFRSIELHAQLYLRPFYESLGFVAQGETYMEAGIEHITMLRNERNDQNRIRKNPDTL